MPYQPKKTPANAEPFSFPPMPFPKPSKPSKPQNTIRQQAGPVIAGAIAQKIKNTAYNSQISLTVEQLVAISPLVADSITSPPSPSTMKAVNYTVHYT